MLYFPTTTTTPIFFSVTEPEPTSTTIFQQDTHPDDDLATPTTPPDENTLEPVTEEPETQMEEDNMTEAPEEQPQQSTYNLRPARGRDFTKHIGPNFVQFMALRKSRRLVDKLRRVHGTMVHAMFTQMQAKQGIRKYGRIAVLAMLKEYTQ